MQQQHWKEADAALRTALQADPSCTETRYLLGYVLMRADQPKASLEVFTEAAKFRPPTSEEFTAVASDYILLKSYPDAQRWLERAVQTTPVSAQAWYLLGRTQYNLDLDADAVSSFQHSLQVIPEDVRSEYNLGLAYERLQQPEQARAAYQQAIEWSEKKQLRDPQPFLDLGVLDRSQGKLQESLPLLQKAAVLSPGNPLIFQELGRTLGELHRTSEAVAALETAIRLAPEAEPPHFLLGRVYRAAGEKAEAESEFKIAQQLLSGASNGTPNVDHAQ